MPRENRRFIRIAVPCKIFISMPQKHTVVTYTEDIGDGGIRINIKEKLSYSSMVDLEIYLKDEKIFSQGKISYTLNYEENPLYYSTGIEFHNMKEVDRRLVNNFVNEIIAKE
jgi:c-di-GMP-binding flagellar brake protein YcgR